MRASKDRLLRAEQIPASLWDATAQCISIVPSLKDVYCMLIQRHDLTALASSRDPEDPPVGGLTKEASDKHFAQAFAGSAARAHLALLDPQETLLPASNVGFRCLLGGNLSFTDAPSGAGASSISFLATIAELRASNVLPRQPLFVHLILAELSDHARALALEVLGEIKGMLESQAIFVNHEAFSWDVTDPLSNAGLIRRITLSTPPPSTCLVLVSNFNAALVREGKRREADKQFEELFRHASQAHGIVLWIEPDMKRATGLGGLFPWVVDRMKGLWSKFISPGTESNQIVLRSSAQFSLPLAPSKTGRVTLAILQFDLGRFQ